MSTIDFSEQALPLPRADLELTQGGHYSNGSPRWLLHDPVADDFYELDSLAARIFKALNTATDFNSWAEHIKRFESGATIDAINERLTFFLNENLLSDADPRVREKKHSVLNAPEQSGFQKLLHNYLFIKVPLFSPEPWIGALAERLRWLRSKPVTLIRWVLVVYCLIVLASRAGELKATFINYLSPAWIVLTVLGLALFKIVHEFAHAVVAKWHGVRVSQIGMAFLVLFPILYTDATDAWRLESPRVRRKIAVSGVMAELHLAGLALAAWSWLPEGWLRSLCFVLFISGLVPSLLINLNPLMRFDAYFWLADYWGVTNLQARAFVTGRSVMRHVLFGLPKEVTGFTPGQELKLALFSYAVWIYRFFLFLGIAILVYSIEFKLLGAFLFVVEIWVFIAKPVTREIGVLWARRAQAGWTLSGIFLTMGLTGLTLAWITPNNQQVTVQAVLTPAQETLFVAQETGELLTFNHQVGAVNEGDLLYEVNVPELLLKLSEEQLQLALNQARLDASLRGQMSQESAQAQRLLVSAEKRVTGAQTKVSETQVFANKTGEWWPVNDLQVSDRVARGQSIGWLIDRSGAKLVAYVPENLRINDVSEFTFVAESSVVLKGSSPVLRTASAERQLSSPLLASGLGGNLAATPNRNDSSWTLVQPLYRITLELDAPFTYATHLRGTLTLQGQQPSRLWAWLGSIANDLRGELQW